MKERRRHPRYNVELDVRFSDYERSMTIKTKDLSLGGVFLFMAKPPPLNTPVALELHLTDEIGDVEVRGHVIHCLKGIGMGIEFTEFSETGKLALDQYLGTLSEGDEA